MENALAFLGRSLERISTQDFKDYEIVITDDSPDNAIEEWLNIQAVPGLRYMKNTGRPGMAHNTNYAIEQAQGELVKVLFLDDYLAHDRALGEMVKHFTPQCIWLATACTHSVDGRTTFNEHKPYYSEHENTIGSPSVIMFRRDVEEKFDPEFHWVLDLDLYKRLHRRYGRPKILNTVNVVIGIHGGQMTNQLSDHRKYLESELLRNKYE
jgi:glycosyltransferase involved in cell wall biosynthesis